MASLPPPPPPPSPFNYPLPPLPPMPFLLPPPPPPSPPRPNLSPFYYGLVVIGSTAVVLAIYNIIFVGCCVTRRERQLRRTPNQSLPEFTSRSFDDNSNSQIITTFKYHKEENEKTFNNECVVCLSVFEDGQEVWQLSLCKHSFHAPCIEMWLNSHSDCPLCRATVGPSPVSHPPRPVSSLQEDREVITV
ncbi:zinc finger protein [Macleaya cordata]|uniref:RING-type E3 ubiquitin transferase n=1 Tax=Macleaya cordata TaxID=56857 RepID=A0A200QES3_MACCD|nr:zinc finger protein [Macleaya cordata]